MLSLYFLIMEIFAICFGNVQNGVLNQDEYMEGDIVIAYDKMGLKMCGRYCMYQKSCTGFNYHEDNRTCELLSLVGGEVSIPKAKSFYSAITTWNMVHDACNPNPCTGRERCVKTVNSDYYCISISVPCDDVVCHNGGTCKNLVSTFECRCVPGALGTYCEFTPCTSGPCLNGGTCSFSGTSYSCACDMGYHGTECQTNVCNPNPCYNGGVCSPTGGTGFACACASGWSEITCQASICDTTPCMYEGTCTPTGATTYNCACHSGFSGLTCQVTPCDVGTHCLNSGTCYISGYTQSCNCPSGFSGNNCEVTPCTPPRCSYGGTCNIVGSSYTCSCPSGYYGSTCQNTPCTGPPCITGTCTVTGSSYYCTCPSSIYSGNNCQYYDLGSITSLNHPLNYPNSHSQSHILISGSSVWKLRIQFDEFITESCCDYFKAYDGSTDSNTLLASWSGSSNPGGVTASGPYMFITFTTDGSVTKSGWRANYYAVLV